MKKEKHLEDGEEKRLPKGFLKMFVLKELMKNSMSGYELMNKIEEKTGTRPSPGSFILF